MRDKIWKWVAIGLLAVNVPYCTYSAWKWKRATDAHIERIDERIDSAVDRLGRLEAAVVNRHPELAPPQSQPQTQAQPEEQ